VYTTKDLTNSLTSVNETVSGKNLHLWHSEQVTDQRADKDWPLIFEELFHPKGIP